MRGTDRKGSMDTLAIDFGNTNTVMAVWNNSRSVAELICIPQISETDSCLIPSVIHFGDHETLIGSKVRSAGLETSLQTFRWMKRYISLNSPYRIQTGKRKIDAREAAGLFLKDAIQRAESQLNSEAEEIIFTVPVESFEHYNDWLIEQFSDKPNHPIRILDEVVAAAAGYGMKFHPGESALFFDFGGSTMQAAVVKLETDDSPDRQFKDRFRVMGKAGCSIGGAVLDRWIMEDVLAKNAPEHADRLLRSDGRSILQACEYIKMMLSHHESIDKRLDVSAGPPLILHYSRQELEQLFNKNKLFESMRAVIQDALLQAADHGVPQSEIQAIIPIGGGSLIPSVRAFLEQELKMALMLAGDPMTAVAIGAANFSHGFGILDFVRHQYAIRVRDHATGEYRFQPVIEPGTNYPSEQAVCSLKIRASRTDQTLFGLAIYEIGQRAAGPENQLEVLFDETGAIRLMSETGADQADDICFWMNEASPLFMKAEPAAEKGSVRFQVDFNISANKMLLLTAEDMLTGKIIFDRYPVIRLN